MRRVWTLASALDCAKAFAGTEPVPRWYLFRITEKGAYRFLERHRALHLLEEIIPKTRYRGHHVKHANALNASK